MCPCWPAGYGWDLQFWCLAVPPCQETGYLQVKCIWPNAIEPGTLLSRHWFSCIHKEVLCSLHGVYGTLVHPRACLLFAVCSSTPGPLQLSEVLLPCLCNACVCNTVPTWGIPRCTV